MTTTTTAALTRRASGPGRASCQPTTSTTAEYVTVAACE
jgi:hypothetical protein